MTTRLPGRAGTPRAPATGTPRAPATGTPRASAIGVPTAPVNRIPTAPATSMPTASVAASPGTPTSLQPASSAGPADTAATVYTTVSSRFQTVIPSEIREKFDVREGSRLMWLDRGDSIEVVPVPVKPWKAFRGAARRSKMLLKGDGEQETLLDGDDNP